MIVVDNASTDETTQVVERAQETSRVPMGRTHERARDRGIACSKPGLALRIAAIIAYIDDDCYPAPDFVDRVIECFQQDRLLGYVGGAVLRFDATSFARVTIVAATRGFEIPAGGFVTPGLMICANLAFRQQALAQIDGFDVMFGYEAGFPGGTDAVIEDLDAAARVSAAGWRGPVPDRA